MVEPVDWVITPKMIWDAKISALEGRLSFAEADRDAWKRKAEAAIEALRPFAAKMPTNITSIGEWPNEATISGLLVLGHLRRAASLVSDHDRASSEMEKNG